jgi:hypothetical protein
MNESTIKKIGQWARYIGAIANWAADSFTSFPKKSEYFNVGAINNTKHSEKERLQ